MRLIIPLLLLAVAIACGAPDGGANEAPDGAPGAGASPLRQQVAVDSQADAAARSGGTTRDARKTILFVGTSLTAGLGLNPNEAYPAVVQRKIDSAGLQYEVRNAGESGETSAGALRRIEWLLREPADVVVIETGANDGLRGVNPDSTRENIRKLVAVVSERLPNAQLVILGMEAPPNLGVDYTTRFREMYGSVAREYGAALVPFLLEGVAGVRALNQGDGIHPNREGAEVVAGLVWKELRVLLGG
jgi:acyl-CoA thioesterase-1